MFWLERVWDAFWDPVGLSASPGRPHAGNGHCRPTRDPQDGDVAERRCSAAVWGQLPPEQTAVLKDACAQG